MAIVCTKFKYNERGQPEPVTRLQSLARFHLLLHRVTMDS
jgi:hypothetical protein